MKRETDYDDGRFFVSPILGCNTHCKFCYLKELNYPNVGLINEFSIQNTVDFIVHHKKFVQGRGGSIISIGAWGDPFPKPFDGRVDVTILILCELSKIGNPIQIMSRNSLDNQIIDAIAKCQAYPRQILFSTSVSSFEHWKVLEINSDAPISRLERLRHFNEVGIETNVMIKPFLPGITNLEASLFVENLTKSCVSYAVVGGLYFGNNSEILIRDLYNSLNIDINAIFNENVNRSILDCSSGAEYNNISTSMMGAFVDELRLNGVKVFKKSSCVNSNILQIHNPSLYYANDPNHYCVSCGNCKTMG